MSESISLAKINQARQALAEARDLYDILDIRDKAKAVAVLAEAQGAGEAANEAKEIQLRAERKAGEFLRVMPKNEGGNPNLLQSATGSPPTLDELGIERTQAHRWQKSAEIPDEKFEDYIQETKASGKELTATGVYQLSKNVHVANNSGINEWYTPPEYIKAARLVMGRIDLDPASSDKANQIVGAATYYTKYENGLDQEWAGRIWMNPPYAQPLIRQFTDKFLSSPGITEACVLVNNATDTAWFQDLLLTCKAVCFIKGRVRFLDPDGNPGAPLQGQAVLYFGENISHFSVAFQQFGRVLYVD